MSGDLLRDKHESKPVNVIASFLQQFGKDAGNVTAGEYGFFCLAKAWELFRALPSAELGSAATETLLEEIVKGYVEWENSGDSQPMVERINEADVHLNELRKARSTALPNAGEGTTSSAMLHWLNENLPDCGDNSCLFGGRGKGGMRTNGGCRCFRDVRPDKKRIFIERMWAAISASSRNRTEAVKLVAAFEKAVEEAIHKLATPANHFHVEELREQLIAWLLVQSATSEREVMPKDDAAHYAEEWEASLRRQASGYGGQDPRGIELLEKANVLDALLRAAHPGKF